MNPFIAPLAISMNQIIQILVILFVLIVPILSQLLAKKQKIPPAGQRPNSPRPRPTDLTQEVEQFLRRAREKPTTATSTSSPTIVRKTPTSMPTRAEPASPSISKSVGGEVAQHVEQYLNEPKTFGQREASLGKEVLQADREIDQHLRQVFDHRISQLASVSGEASAPPSVTESLEPAVAETSEWSRVELLEWLGNPDSLRQAIVLQEILHRPEERWT